MSPAVLLVPFVLAGEMTAEEADAVAIRILGRHVPNEPSAWLAIVREALEAVRNQP